MVFKLPKPKRRVNEKMTLEALHRSAETYRDMYEDIRKKNDILQKQLDIAVEGLNQYAKPRNVNMYDGDYTISMGCRYLSDNGEVAKKYLQQIEELNK